MKICILFIFIYLVLYIFLSIYWQFIASLLPPITLGGCQYYLQFVDKERETEHQEKG